MASPIPLSLSIRARCWLEQDRPTVDEIESTIASLQQKITKTASETPIEEQEEMNCIINAFKQVIEDMRLDVQPTSYASYFGIDGAANSNSLAEPIINEMVLDLSNLIPEVDQSDIICLPNAEKQAIFDKLKTLYGTPFAK